MRRLRRTPQLRGLVAETRLNSDCFVYPLFVQPGSGRRDEIASMPGQFRWSVDRLPGLARDVRNHGIPAVILFGLPEHKDEIGSGAWAPDGIVQRAVRAMK